MLAGRARLGAAVMIAFLLAGGHASAAAFDCTKAKSKPEKALCADPLVSRLDDDLARYYAVAIEGLQDGANCLKADQRRWVKTVRDGCGSNATCLKTAYLERLGSLDGLQPGASAIKDIKLPAVPTLVAAIPPESDAGASHATQSLSVTGTLLHEQADANQMGLAIKPAGGQARAFVLDMSIGNSLNHETVRNLIDTEPNGLFQVRGLATAEGDFADDRCRFVYRATP